MDILGGDMNDGRLPGQRTRCHSIVQTRSGENLAHPKIQSFPDRLNGFIITEAFWLNIDFYSLTL